MGSILLGIFLSLQVPNRDLDLQKCSEWDIITPQKEQECLKLTVM